MIAKEIVRAFQSFSVSHSVNAPLSLSLSLSFTLIRILFTLYENSRRFSTAAATDELFSPVNISELSKNILWGKHRWRGGPPVVCICLPWKWNSSKIERNAFQIQPADISIYPVAIKKERGKKGKKIIKKRKNVRCSLRAYKTEEKWEREKRGERREESPVSVSRCKENGNTDETS